MLLLPLRLEVRRIVNDLCIRVFPDQPFANTHQGLLTAEERAAGIPLADLLEAASNGGEGWTEEALENARGEWRELAHRYGVSRAAWIVESLKSDRNAQVTATNSDVVPRLFLLPPVFHFLIYKGGQLAYHCSGGAIRPGLTLMPAPTHDKSPTNDGLFDADSKWVTDFQTAIDAGLGIKIPLSGTDASDPALRFSEIVVVGLREDGPADGIQTFSQCVRSHRFTEGFEFLPYGSATNNTVETASVHSESEEQLLAAFDYEILSPLAGLAPDRKEKTAATQLARALGLGQEAAVLDHIKGGDILNDSHFPLTFQALWPATGDYFLSKMINEDAPAGRPMLQSHASDYLRPRGTLCAIRIGNLPYAVIPVSRTKPHSANDPTGWKSSELDYPQDHFKPYEWAAFDAAFYKAIRTLLPLWLARASDTSVVPKAGTSHDPDDEILKLLGMEPHSMDYRTRPLVDQSMVMLLLKFLTPIYFGPGSNFAVLGNESTSVAAWTAEKLAVTDAIIALLQNMGASAGIANSPLLRLFAWGAGGDLPMPLVRNPDPTLPADGPEHYLPFLLGQGGAASNTLFYDLLRRSLVRASELAKLSMDVKSIVSKLADYPIVEYFNGNVTAADLDALFASDPPLASAPDTTDVANSLKAARQVPRESFSSVSEIQRIIDATVLENVALKLRARFDTRFESGLRDVTDALTYRLDAWFTTLPARRLHRMRIRNGTGLHWGAYGYLEDIELPPPALPPPVPASSAEGGYVHAPSVGQATAAAMLRSAFDSHRIDGSNNAYTLNLTSNRVRRALEIIDGIQQGQELPALLGYQFERGLHGESLDWLIDDFRAAFPIAKPEETDVPELAEAIAARNVVDGRQLAEAFNGTLSFAGKDALNTALSSPTLTDPLKVQWLLEDLRDALDAVGDLLLFEGVFQAAQGNYDRSGAALDACAGLGRPPEIDSVSTASKGISLRQRVCLLLPCTYQPVGNATGPRAEAEPRFNAWVGSLLGPLADINCVPYSPPTAETGGQAVTLAALGISQLDFLHMCTALPSGVGDTELEVRIRRFVRARDGLSASTGIRIAFEESPSGRSIADAMEFHRALLDMLGSASTLTPDGLFHPDEAAQPVPLAEGAPAPPPPPVLYPATAVSSFRARAEHARRLLAGEIAFDDDGNCIPDALASTDPTLVFDALNVCLGFGIQEALVESAIDPTLAQRAVTVRDIARKRVQQARELINAGAQDVDTSVAPLTAAFKALFGESFLAFAPFDVSALGTAAAPFDGTTLNVPPAENRIWLWLQQVAETHPRVRKLETLLMTAEGWGYDGRRSSLSQLRVEQLPFRPTVGWQALDDTELQLDDTELQGTTGSRTRGCQSIVAMVPDAVDQACMSGFVIDEWTEIMPRKEVTTGISFECKQPTSQAPHCFLIATPGNFDVQYWSFEHLSDIVRDTMELAKARLVDLDAFPAVAGVFPALTFPVSDATPKIISVPVAGTMGRADLADQPAPSSAEFADAFSSAR